MMSTLGLANFPPIRGVLWFNLCILLFTPILTLYGLVYVHFKRETLVCSILYYVFSTIGEPKQLPFIFTDANHCNKESLLVSLSCGYITRACLFIHTGYHRLWSHRSYKASLPLQYFLILAGGSAVQGSCFWWARRHRSHHRHTDTDKDPYNAKRGLLWSHIGWIIFDSNIPPGPADISDLRSDAVVQWQHRWYLPILIIFGYALPALIPGVFWCDWKGGICFVGALRMTICHHVSLLSAT